MDETQALANSHSAEAVNAAAVATEAAQKAQAAQIEAIVINAMRKVFGPLQVKNETDQMHILLPKIPLLCLSVEKMGNDLFWIKWLLMGLVGGIGAIIVGVSIAAISKL